MNAPALRLYFDGQCPFCTAEMGRLRRWDSAGRLAFIDIAEDGFDPAQLGVDMAALNTELYSRTADGQVLVGIDSLLAAYSLVGRGWLVSPLRVRALRPLLASLYRGFARNRYRFSRLLGYQAVPACDAGVCRTGHPFLPL
ncbi:Predicted thiol-disulfide oxidoreductase YuxK, DCC family [Rhodoferax sp. OV413]|uniref:thiol-disulfide oxidoreductase DCC family protein n=1 Tax=Rhodoferax sp. OV413 TaxID=1855285 RepID=UPI00088936A0|nr:DUF393 domain-containing protein [Rhodoferax sp. OV413]SDP67340.1 Predicted thiol-disulfide oxidoreductase YuxK, DCC family [Rhodoferax sp. OV413]